MIKFGEQTLYLGATSFQPRQNGGPGTSSPEWVKRLVASRVKPDAALITACEKRLTDLGDVPGDSPTCTTTSKQCELRIIVDVGALVETDAVYTVELLAYKALMDFAQPQPPDTVEIKELKATAGTFDPDPSKPPKTREARTWRVMSDLAESMIANFKP